MSTAAASPPDQPSQADVDAKVLKDLETVKEKMDVCDNMLHPGDGSPAPSLKNNEALLGVIGFLEACAPRMVELVEAATSGALGEAVLMECLSVNDRLLKLLADIDTYAFTETAATTTAAAAPPPSSVNQQFGDLLLDDSDKNPPAPAPPVGGGKTTGEDDPFGNSPVDLLGSAAPMPASDALTAKPPPPAAAEDSKPAAAPAAAPPAAKDDFDDFFAERTSS